jgi:Fe-S oxidoreductase
MSKIKNLEKQWEAVFSCMLCGDCGYAIRPAVGRYLTCPIKEAKGEEAFEIYFSRGRMNVLKSILEGKLPLNKELAEFVYQCSECGNCTEVCHQTQNENIVLNTSKWIDHVEVWNALRKDLVEQGYAPLDRHKQLIEFMEDSEMNNPYGEKREEKYAWASEFSNIKQKGELAFFGGCTMPLRQSDTLKNMMEILQRAGKEIALSKNERCCGSIALRIGDEKAASKQAEENVRQLEEMGAKTVFTACAGCYRTLKKDYPDILGKDLPFEIKHITEILYDLLKKKELTLNQASEESYKITYHDPCHLGRHMDLYEIPRKLLELIPGVELVEMKRNRSNAWCCGAGGGLKSQFPELASKISQERINEAINTRADILTTSCPFCINNLNDAYNIMELEAKEKIHLIDLIDFIVTRL